MAGGAVDVQRGQLHRRLRAEQLAVLGAGRDKARAQQCKAQPRPPGIAAAAAGRPRVPLLQRAQHGCHGGALPEVRSVQTPKVRVYAAVYCCMNKCCSSEACGHLIDASWHLLCLAGRTAGAAGPGQTVGAASDTEAHRPAALLVLKWLRDPGSTPPQLSHWCVQGKGGRATHLGEAHDAVKIAAG